MQRRAFAAAALAACAWPALAADSVDSLLAEGEQALQAGDALRALQAFERAASLRHDPVAEWGMVRSWMQSGEYRRALAFAAHAAEGHAELSEGAGLYAWLLCVGGQQAMAERTLDAALQRQPNDALLQATQQRLRAPAALPDARLLQGPLRQGPEPAQGLPTASRAVASGLLMPGGQRAIVPVASVQNVSALWLRAASGRTMSARLVSVVAELGLAELSLDLPLKSTAAAWPVGERDAFPGSPEMAFEFASPSDAASVPLWPLLHTGFVGRWQSGSVYALGAELASPGGHGGPVYDTAGRLIGVALRAADRQAQLLGASALRAQWPTAFAAPRPGELREALSPDAVYERAMAMAVQVIVVQA
ncbi:MAG: hypothetical protein ABI605_06615 [Rhizobacter sp.]